MTSRLQSKGRTRLAVLCLLAAAHPLQVEAEISRLRAPSDRPMAEQTDLRLVATRVVVVTRRRTVTGLFLLQRSRQAVAYVSETAIILSRQGTLRSTPFLRACARAARALQTVDHALSAHDGRAFASAMAASSSAIGRLDATYRLAARSDRKLQQGMRTLDVAWRAFARDAGRGAVVTSQQRIANGRRIASLRRRLVALRTRRAQSATEVTQIDYLISGLDRASRANRSSGYEWLALGLFDEMAGQFSGYYDDLSLTDPLAALAYRSDYAFAAREEALFAGEFMSSYGTPSWSRFDESYAVANDPAFFGEPYPLLDRDLDASAAGMERAADDAGGAQSLADAEAQAVSSDVAQAADPATERDVDNDALADQPADTTDLKEDAVPQDDDRPRRTPTRSRRQTMIPSAPVPRMTATRHRPIRMTAAMRALATRRMSTRAPPPTTRAPRTQMTAATMVAAMTVAASSGGRSRRHSARRSASRHVTDAFGRGAARSSPIAATIEEEPS